MSKESKTNIFHNFYECPCGETWEDHWSCACNDKCPSCNAEIEPYKSRVEPYVIELPCYGIRVELNQVDPEDGEKFIGGTIQSKMHDGDAELPFNAAIEALESMILACACAGIDIESPPFIEAIETTADTISNEYGE